MTEFVLALAAFVASHIIPARPALRERLIATLGRRLYLGAYSVLSLALLAWLIVAARRAPTILLWEPAPWQWLVPLAVMPLAFWLVAAGLAAPNPLSISFRRSAPDAKPGGIVAVTRHPVLWGFLLWALAHIPPNGDLVALILFGGMALLAALGLRLVDARARRRMGAERFAHLAAATSVVPFGAILAGRARLAPTRPLLVATALALALYAWFVGWGHALLIGPDPLAGL